MIIKFCTEEKAVRYAKKKAKEKPAEFWTVIADGRHFFVEDDVPLIRSFEWIVWEHNPPGEI